VPVIGQVDVELLLLLLGWTALLLGLLLSSIMGQLEGPVV
jgi:hypothetical protein